MRAGRLGPAMIHNRDRTLGSGVLCGYTALPQAFCEKASQMDPSEVRRLITVGFSDAIVEVLSEDNTHFEALVVAAEFAGKRPLARHQLVYRCLGALVGNEIHALSITALTPDEWRERSGES